MNCHKVRPKIPFRFYVDGKKTVILIDLDVAKQFKKGELTKKNLLTYYYQAS
ncbi:hypothetical protein VCRA2116O30_20228 [Vibrio crassostreae]|uniref:hypothetical protein n=1 Tax=Vibrio crassostreae TaxID=246167 RepID=UPI0010D4C57E|nr:hypothetical protein [Vibrio crassostreae]TCT63730.1 hypothetical protein EDB40_101222 [Vibrio crassostreae]CAK2014014.1 hypothetical protein VCRA2116O30_20228 [Vibrio crassostreae]CAK2077193.1 hypothetical protein VCRA2113O20_30089 [Vibrio crassostreae]CAK2084619.1 hypothetical protein VCRA2119O45_30228 [Vibrio crassostreae]CAK2142758.1 hypothetical protein VCRA2117O39_40228 [Vibrio crassostreae]